MRSGVVERSVQVRRWLARYRRRAPGQLTLLLTVLVLLCLTTGAACALDLQRRKDELAGIADRSAPLTGAAVDIYQSLSDADATAASAFLLVGGVEPAELRERYQLNIAETSTALTTASAGSPTGESAVTVTELAAYLPVYTGLVEAARMYNRLGMPQGVSYLREASHLVQSRMLPSAQRLYRAEITRLAEAQANASVVGWILLTLGILVVGGLVAAQIYLARTTRRILNKGLLVATLAAVAAVSWFTVATTSAAEHTAASRHEGSAAVEALVEARIKVLEARSDEALTLVARGGGKVYEDHFNGVKSRLEGGEGLLAQAKAAAASPQAGQAVDNAITAWQAWLVSHQALRDKDDEGDYNEAIRLAADQGPSGAGRLSSTVDGQLGEAIRHAATRFEEESAKAGGALSTADIGVALLMVLAALGVVAGFAPRLREYR
ncbi:hypothetical protein JOF56_008042 [Kibdelosporangium banguiense]|uniref:Secreted protein n=1 Tax=Kibdelosporangium banguiense TaxID=1365924 RepID=A0ABS4TTE5_9PSEU|nr:hypothetical protein [Kibdelosporangium banguiense]MBP2327657.1 hypothetical protein [Kibdelosporangium banguiense]